MELGQRELELITLRTELRNFESRYMHIVGSFFTEL